MIVIIFSCLILYAAKPASTSCPLEITPNFVLVPFGGSISAVCKSLSSQLKGMGWESSFGGTGLVKGVSNLTLKIDSLQSWHVSPICFVNLNGSQCTKDLPVTVYNAPTFSQPTNETLTLQVGSQMSLDCSASGNPLPEYSWKMPYTSKVLTETQSVFNSSFKHPGPYECTAANSQGTITKRFTITQAPRPRRTLALMLGLFVGLAVMLCILGYFFVTPQGTFSSKKQSYTPGSATSAPV
ncbi:matrix-remodeling-associated protein 5-like isoform X2 [Hippocampus zosterae]|uniref:matrix-remodeling-associated protein 5-like isoform X2 n=1 Tax=Hippocampus zosterae TaxID=109293 RepID=UPI00223CAD5D|nr:matrix-remodeling-associated protein 5-like isoform X2 [Hippocampus zosterae]